MEMGRHGRYLHGHMHRVQWRSAVTLIRVVVYASNVTYCMQRQNTGQLLQGDHAEAEQFIQMEREHWVKMQQ